MTVNFTVLKQGIKALELCDDEEVPIDRLQGYLAFTGGLYLVE